MTNAGRQRTRRTARKARFVALVAGCRGYRLRLCDIGALFNVTPQRIGQVVIEHQLDPPKFAARADVLNWLYARDPELAKAVRRFQKEISTLPARVKLP